jgi:hypothetical protein
MSFSVDWDLSELQAAMADADGMLDTGVSDAIQTGLDAGVAFAKANHTYKDQTANLTASIGHEGDALVAKADYASFVEEATSPHEIEVKNARALHWIGRDGGHRFAQRVQHPGTSAQPFMQPAAEHAAEIAKATIEGKVVGDIQARLKG